MESRRSTQLDGLRCDILAARVLARGLVIVVRLLTVPERITEVIVPLVGVLRMGMTGLMMAIVMRIGECFPLLTACCV